MSLIICDENIAIIYFDNIRIINKDDVTINHMGYLDIAIIPKEYRLFGSGDGTFINADGTSGFYIRCYSYTDYSVIGVYIGDYSLITHDNFVLGNYGTLVFPLTRI